MDEASGTEPKINSENSMSSFMDSLLGRIDFRTSWDEDEEEYEFPSWGSTSSLRTTWFESYKHLRPRRSHSRYRRSRSLIPGKDSVSVGREIEGVFSLSGEGSDGLKKNTKYTV